MVTSSLRSALGKRLSDAVVAAVMIDRLVHDADVLTLTGESYRSVNTADSSPKRTAPPTINAVAAQNDCCPFSTFDRESSCHA